ncbi:metallopeptidase [Actinorhabdospora filicis]|uniref:Aminopeptidase N n=1 Tax=Actinorhabdospora filicis TaxID=1785913 RepID=A0A9W6SI09_9ACTN|nr:M1 family metallopeptidase [Actinorhabdospora filicis]GLZ75849.1 metallopeptidase [Actinorhabdospora filicis]
MKIRATAMVVAACGLLAACTSTPPAADPRPAPSAPADLAAGLSEPVADPVYPDLGNPGTDVLHYGLSLSYEPDARVLKGHAVITVRATGDASSLRLDLAETMKVSAVTADGRAVEHRHTGNDLEIVVPVTTNAVVVLAVDYAGEPTRAPAPASRGDMTEGVGMSVGPNGAVWTFQEPYGAFTWYPVNDQPSDEALYDITASVPEGWTGVATGVPSGEETTGGRHVTQYHSADPVASYVVTFAVDRFVRIDGGETDGGAPIVSWVRENSRSAWEPILATIGDKVAWLEKRYGPYPFAHTGVVAVGGESGMETQGTITLSDGIANVPKEAEAVLLHELAHQWYGDAVTPSDWRGVWLNEGMATFVQAQWVSDMGGETLDAAIARWRGMDARMRTSYGPPGSYRPGDFASGNVYYCPALMLAEIRARMGEAPFEAMMRDWVQQQRNTHQDRASFTAWVVERGGTDMRVLIDTWLDSPTTPA